jgi:hypothetical protein
MITMGLVLFLSIAINAQQGGVPQQITPDGNTSTTVKVSGTTTNITTSTVQGAVAYNSFTTFNVAQGNTTNLIFPNGTLNLLNLVNSQAINIWGILNSIQDGKVGGNVLFADPFGIVVGKSGTINVGALTVITPTQSFMDSFFSAPGTPSASATSALMSGAVPISSDGTVLVQGKINAISNIMLVGENVTNSGAIASGAVFKSTQPDFSDVVNVNGLTAGTALSTTNGNIEIVAEGDFQNSGVIATNGASNLNAGNIGIQAGKDVTLSSGTLISASGEGENSNGGSVKIRAGNNAQFDEGGLIVVSGGNISGNGGSVDLNAKNVLTLAGGSFEAGAAHGQAGNVLVDPTETDITGNVSTGGGDYTNTGDSIYVYPGVTINTQPATTGSGTTSGNISLTTLNTQESPAPAQIINIGGCGTQTPCTTGTTTLNASDPGGTAGNVTLTATSTVSKTWNSSSPDPAFNTDQANASITIGSNAVIEGNNISITASSTTSKTVSLTETADGSQASAPDPLCIVLGGQGGCGSNTSPVSVTDSILGMVGNTYSSPSGSLPGDTTVTSGWAGGVLSQATSNIQVQGGAQITATGTVTINSQASSTASMTANGLYFTYAESDASATAVVQTGATITAGGDFDLTANSTNTLTNTGQAVSGQPNLANSTVTQTGPAVAVTYSVGNSTAVAGVESGATVSADNVNVLAQNTNSFTTAATPSVNINTKSTTSSQQNQQFGAGVAIAVSDTNSSADAYLNGSITAAGEITLNAQSLDNTNSIDAEGEASNDSITGNDSADDAIKYVGGKLSSNSSGNKGSDAQDNTPAFELGAAVAIVSDSNTASSTVGPSASLSAVGNITIEANASDTFQVKASGTADEASVSIGGGVAVTTYTNSATASVGDGATVDAGGTLVVNATAELPNPFAADLETLESYLETFSISGSPSDLASLVSSVRNELSGSGSGSLSNVWDSIKTVYSSITSPTSSVSSVGQPGGNGVGVSGAVDLLTANNTATAFIDQKATVSAAAVTVESSATTASVNAAGTSAAQQTSTFQTLCTKFLSCSENSDQSLGGFGGTYSGITYNNTSNSFIGGGASVTTTSGDVDVTSSATNFMANKFASGADSSGGTIALSGAVSNVTINSDSYATISDQANVTSAGNVNVNAVNSTQVFQLGINTDSSGNVAAGVALAFLNINNTTEGFIGNNNGITGETPSGSPGQVTAADDVNVTANSYELLIAAAASSVSNKSSNSTSNTGAAGATSTPSSGETSGTNNTADSNSTVSTSSYSQGSGNGFGISGDIAFNNVTDTTLGYISNGVTVKSASTSVSATDNALMAAVDGGLVRASTFGLQAAFADNSISKTTEAYTNGVTIDSGSLSVTADSSDLVIAASAGGAGAQGSSSYANIAGSVDYNDIGNTTTATLEDTTVRGQSGGTSPTGAVTVSASNDETEFSLAGSLAYGSGDAGVGVGLDLGNVNNTVTAGIDSASNVLSNTNVGVTASDNENQLSMAADLAVTGSNEIAASISYQMVTKNVDAYIDGTVNAAGNVTVAANDDQGGTSYGLPTGLIAVAGAVPVSGSGGDTGLGASGTVSITDKTVQATIGNGATVNSTAGNVNVTALATDNLYLFAFGGAYGEDAGVMGSAVVNTITNNTSASIGAATVIGQNVNVTASDTLYIIDGAGGFSGSDTAAVGAGGDVECIGTGTGACPGSSPLTVTASIASGANVSATAGNVEVTATETPTITSVAADAGYSGDATVIGSGTVLNFNTATTAYSSGNVTATGALDISAEREDSITTVAGQAALGGDAGVGISVSFVDKSDTVSAYVGGGTDTVGGLLVSATGNDTITPIAAGGDLSEEASVAGAGVVNILNETTEAYIGSANVSAGVGGVSVQSTSDTNFTLSLAGVLAVGASAGVGAAADVASITKNTTAEIESGAIVSATGDVTVGANAEESSSSIVAAAGLGEYAGVAMATSVYIINNTTQASVNAGATVVADDSVDVSSNDQTDLDLFNGHVSGGIAGIGAALPFADVTKNTDAFVDGSVTAEGGGAPINADNGTFSITYAPFGSGPFSFGSQVPDKNSDFFSNPMFTGERRASPNTTAINGLAVTATSENDFNTVAAGVAGGYAAVVVNGSILLLNNNTKAEIGSGANIGTGTDSVLVAAGTDVGHIGSALGAGGGIATVIPSADISIINDNTTAAITGATVNASGNVTVNANASEDDLSLVVGVGGGVAGVAGSVSYFSLNDTTTADISGGSLTAGGNLAVTSNDTTQVALLVGALGAGAVGVGGSVAVDLVNKTTEAYFTNGTNTTAGGSTTVSANSSETLEDGTIAGGLGIYAGVAGGVSFESDNSTTSAEIGTGTDTATDGLNVFASNTANVTTFDGTIGGAIFAGVSGAVDVGNIENSTTAEINGANVSTTSGSVDVAANETRDINSEAISGAFGIGGVEASVIDWGVSAGINTTGAALSTGNPLGGGNYSNNSGNHDTANNTANTQANTAASGASGVLSGLGGGEAGKQAATANSELGTVTGGQAVNNAVNEGAPAQGTTAEIYGGSINSGGGVSVTSSDATYMTLNAPGASLGAAGLGASIAIGNVDTSSTAEIIGGSTITAGGDVFIDAGLTNDLTGNALAGHTGAILSGGAAIAVLNDNATTDAEMDATVNESSGVEITADTTRNDSATSGNDSISGVVAAGYSYASVSEGGSTTAQIDGGSSTLPAVQSVTVSAEDNSTANSNATANTAGIVGVGGAEADATIDPTVNANIGGGATVDAADFVDVTGTAIEDVYSNVTGVNAGGASIGTGSTANATAQPTVYAYIAGNVDAGGNVFVGGTAGTEVDAGGSSSAGALFASVNNGATVNANSYPTVFTFLTGTTVTSGGNVDISSYSGSSVSSEANGASIALVNIPGYTVANSNIINNNTAFVSGSTVNASNFFLTAESSDTGSSSVTGSNYGLVSLAFDSTSAASNISGTTEALLENGSTINAVDVAQLMATVYEYGYADASTTSAGVITTGEVTASVGNQYGGVDTPEVVMGPGTTINATTASLEANLAEALFTADAYDETIAAASSSTATSNVYVTGNPMVQVSGNITAPQEVSLIATVNSAPTEVNTTGDANGEIEAGITGNNYAYANNYTTFSPTVTVAGTPTPILTTNDLYIQATAPISSSMYNPFYSNTATATSNTVVSWVLETVQEVVDEVFGWIPFVGQLIEQVTEWVTQWVEQITMSNTVAKENGSFMTNQGITLSANIFQQGTGNPILDIGQNGSVITDQGVPYSISGDNIIIGNMAPPPIVSITLDTPGGFTAGSSTVHVDTTWSAVTITNSSSDNLVINNISTFSNGSNSQPAVNITANPNENNATFNFITDNGAANIDITNNSPTADTNIFLNGTINDPGGNVNFLALLGSILQYPNISGDTNETVATNVTLNANHGDIGSMADPLNLMLETVETPAETASATALAGENLYLNVTPVENFQPGASVPSSVPVNLTSLEAGDNIGLTLNPAIAWVPVITPETITITIPVFNISIPITFDTYVNTPYAVNGLFNLTGDITAGGNVNIMAPAQTTLNMETGSTITSGFENIYFTVNPNGTWSSFPIPVNYSNSIGGGTVVMENLQQQGGDVTISGGGELTGNGTIDVLNGYTNVIITNNSTNNLQIGNMLYDTPVTGTISIPVNGTITISGTTTTYTNSGGSIALTETNNPTSTITINQNGTGGNVLLTGDIGNQSGTTNITALDTNISNTGGSAQVVESNYINLSAGGEIGTAAMPVNIQVDNGYVDANAPGVISLDQVLGNLNVGTIDSTGGNVYLTAYQSILDALPTSLISGINLDLDALNGSIGTSSGPVLIDATGTLTADADMNVYITQITGPLNVANVTADTGNVILTTDSGNINLGTNSVDAPEGTATLDASANITDATSSTAITATNVDLNSATGNVGFPPSPANPPNPPNPIEVYATGTVSSSAPVGNIWINETMGSMNVGTISAPEGSVNLTALASGASILNGNTASGNVNVTGETINLTSAGMIGTPTTPLTADTDAWWAGLNATAPLGINITAPSGNFYVENVDSTSAGNIGLTATTGDLDLVDNVTANNGNVTLTSGGNTNLFGVVDALAGNTTITAGNNIFNSFGISPSINTQGISLTATNGTIGTPLDFLRIHSNAGTTLATPADVSAMAQWGIYLDETSGPLYVSHITSNLSDIFIISNGSILNGNTNGSVNLTGNNINLVSNNGGIGSSTLDLLVNDRNGVNTVPGSAGGDPYGNSLNIFANGSINLEEQNGDLISFGGITSLTGNVNLDVANGSAGISSIDVGTQGNPAFNNVGTGSTQTVTILVQGDVLNVNSIFNANTLTMTVLPSTNYHWTSTPGTDTIYVGEAGVFSTINATADNVYMPDVYALNQSTNTNDISRQTNGLHFNVEGYGNPGGHNYVTDLANNVDINVSPCPKGCSTVPAVVFNNLITNYANINVGEQWLETINTIIGTSAQFNSPYLQDSFSANPKEPSGAGRYTPFYVFMIGNNSSTDASPTYWVTKTKVLKAYTLTQPLKTIISDLIKYYALP